MMNYAEKELREAIAYLDEARTQEETLKATLRLLELGEPVEVSFRSGKGTVTTLCPGKTGIKLVYALLERAELRIDNLEKQEAYWGQEVAMVQQAQQINRELRTRPNASLNSLRREEGKMPLGELDPSPPTA